MNNRKYALPALFVALVLGLGTAAAQAFEGNGQTSDIDDSFSDFESRLDDLQEDAADFSERGDALADRDVTFTRESTRESSVDFDEDTVLLAIALSNNGFDVDASDIGNRDVQRTSQVSFATSSSLDRDDVFSALILGESFGTTGGGGGNLAAVSDRSVELSRDVSVQRDVSLDEDTVLLGIALQRNLGGSIEFDDIATISEEASVTTESSQDVDIDREDALLLLALGG